MKEEVGKESLEGSWVFGAFSSFEMENNLQERMYSMKMNNSICVTSENNKTNQNAMLFLC